jgi:hypothetical protein
MADLRISGNKIILIDSSENTIWGIATTAGEENQVLQLNADGILEFQDPGFTGRSIAEIDDVDSTVDSARAGQYLKFDGEYWIADSVQAGGSSNIDSAIVDAIIDSALATKTFTASNANQLNNQNPSYYLNYNNFTNTPTITDPAITTNGSSPSLASGISEAEVRSLIGAGTSNFDGEYSSLSGAPAIIDSANVDALIDSAMGSLDSTGIQIGNWSLYVDTNNNLIMAYDGTVKGAIGTDGTITAIGDLEAYGSV